MIQYTHDKLHGLSVAWHDEGDIAVELYKNDKNLGYIAWNTSNWTEIESYNPSVFDGVLSIDDFRPKQ